MERVFKRKIYQQLLEWKETENGRTAILVEGARRVGKSTLVEQFAKNEYKSYILIDFNKASKRIKALFDDLMDIDRIFRETFYTMRSRDRAAELRSRCSVGVMDLKRHVDPARFVDRRLSKRDQYLIVKSIFELMILFDYMMS